MKELKEMMSSLINNITLPSRGSSKRKKGKSSGTEHGSSSDETGSRKHIHASKSWDSMCEYDDNNHRKQRSSGPAFANDNSATSVREGTDIAALDNWQTVQINRPCSPRRGYPSARNRDSNNRDFTIPPPISPFSEYIDYNKDVILFGHAPEPIEEDKTWRLVGGNTNGIKPYGGSSELHLG
jgi:hypothetical protein